MEENEILNDFYTKLTKLVNQMKINGQNISDKRPMEKILINFLKKLIILWQSIKKIKFDSLNFIWFTKGSKCILYDKENRRQILSLNVKSMIKGCY